ncbi:unnamed protein product [Thlaspi arvense]|uniref:SWIM-type domain-containing protein n=1 Tax=Thlaspi arvense TaxID=13288 RepID=A0AAU9T7I2_THLAR|nr:unnamed protein product [Thlaspi arvense]
MVDNMKKVSWFPPETPGKKEDIEDDETLRRKVLHYALSSGAMTLYIVREDDLYIGRHFGINVVRLSDEIADSDSSSSDSEGDDVVEEESEEEEQHDSSSETDLAEVGVQVDESKCRNFRLGQEYSSIESFKSAITRYAVRKRRALKYEKSDSKRVVVICSDKACPWRISAFINSSSIRVVVRAFNDEHDCTWQGKAAYNDLKIYVYCPWSIEFSKCDAVENNLGELFKAAIRIARTKPVVEMLEDIRQCKRLEAEKAKGDYTPRAKALLEQQIHKIKDCIPLSCGMGEFVVMMRGDISCGCRMYKVSGIPCYHIISALCMGRQADQDPKTLLSHWFTVQKLRSCYAYPLKAVGGMNMWDKSDVRINPPPYKKPPRRPPGKKRKREVGEARPGMLPKRGIKIHCDLCRQDGHNMLYCESLPVEGPPKNPCGRPRIRPITSSQMPVISASSSQAPVNHLKHRRFLLKLLHTANHLKIFQAFQLLSQKSVGENLAKASLMVFQPLNPTQLLDKNLFMTPGHYIFQGKELVSLQAL